MKKNHFGIYGASGCGRSLMPVARDQLSHLGIKPDQLIFIDDGCEKSLINGHEVMSYQRFLELGPSSCLAVIAISNSKIRQHLAQICKDNGLDHWILKASNSIVMDDVEIGEGAAISPFVTIGSNVRIGRHFHANLYSYVEHDCVIGDFVTFAPGVKCNGNIVIEDHAYIGAGAVIKQGNPGRPLVIGRGAVVGMGAVVTRSVKAGATVVGNPARSLIVSSKGK